jgi:hypothetical protein
VFHLESITLLQAEEVVGVRVPGGSDELGGYLLAVRSLVANYYSSTQVAGPRALLIAAGPGGRVQFWLAAPDALSEEERARVHHLASAIPGPAVVEGPIALALVYSVGPTPVPQAGPTLPVEWQTIVRNNGGPLAVEAIVERLWAAQNH